MARGLLRDERMHLEPASDLARADALVGEALGPSGRDRRGSRASRRSASAHPSADGASVRTTTPSRGGAGDVTASPRVGHGEDRRLGSAHGELLDDGARDLFPVRPRRELLNLGGEVANVLADRLDERPACVAVGGGAEPRELLADPLGQLFFATSYVMKSPAFATAFASAESFLSPSPTSTRTVVGSRRGEVRLDLFDVGGLPRLDPVDDDERDSPPKRPSGCRPRRRRRRTPPRREGSRSRPHRSARAAVAARARSSAGRSP